MKSVNLFIGVGNITADPETKALKKTDRTVTSFSIAMNRVWYDKNEDKQEDVTYLDCVAWGNMGENIAKYHEKGDPIYVQGYLALNRWEDKEGNQRSKIELVVQDFTIIKPYEGDKGGRSPGRSDRGGRSARRRDDDGDALPDERNPEF